MSRYPLTTPRNLIIAALYAMPRLIAKGCHVPQVAFRVPYPAPNAVAFLNDCFYSLWEESQVESQVEKDH